MKFVRTGDDAFEVTMNLDTMTRISSLQGDERDAVIAKSFATASESFAADTEDAETNSVETHDDEESE
ncbi:hypothetical protein SEA_MOAB_159 [Streptomyces phage Moab]|nr:hypothetical protein SEA_MOAB_159 [Streptomyces phage Moab]WMI33771.1 hypothetical protein SEA_PATELGO_161 [Streptomyces phage Patelgo]